jgi:hypothetical protein
MDLMVMPASTRGLVWEFPASSRQDGIYAESSGGSVLAQCASPDGVTAFALERVGLYTHVLVRPEDDEDRACIERELDAAHLEPGRSYGFRPAPLRFSAPTSAPTSSAAPAAAVPDSATAPDPAAAAEPTPEQ